MHVKGRELLGGVQETAGASPSAEEKAAALELAVGLAVHRESEDAGGGGVPLGEEDFVQEDSVDELLVDWVLHLEQAARPVDAAHFIALQAVQHLLDVSLSEVKADLCISEKTKTPGRITINA